MEVNLWAAKKRGCGLWKPVKRASFMAYVECLSLLGYNLSLCLLWLIWCSTYITCDYMTIHTTIHIAQNISFKLSLQTTTMTMSLWNMYPIPPISALTQFTTICLFQLDNTNLSPQQRWDRTWVTSQVLERKRTKKMGLAAFDLIYSGMRCFKVACMDLDWILGKTTGGTVQVMIIWEMLGRWSDWDVHESDWHVPVTISAIFVDPQIVLWAQFPRLPFNTKKSAARSRIFHTICLTLPTNIILHIPTIWSQTIRDMGAFFCFPAQIWHFGASS